MGDNLLYDVDPVELTATARGVQDAIEENSITAQLLPRETTTKPAVEFTVGAERFSKGSTFRAFDAESNRAHSYGGEKRSAFLQPQSIKESIGELEFLGRAGSSGDDALSARVDQIIRNLVRRMILDLDGLRGQALLTGGVVVEFEDGGSQTIDYGRRSDFTKTASTLWSDEAADPIADLETWRDEYVEENGEEPSHLIVPRRVVSALMRNENIRDYLGATTFVSQESLGSVLASHGLPSLTVHSSRTFSQDHILFATSGIDALGSTVWGTTSDPHGDYEALGASLPGIVIGSYRQNDPDTQIIRANATVLPLLKNANLSLSAQVLSS
ncbi:major capsid protein [Nesterenkonia suensis]